MLKKYVIIVLMMVFQDGKLWDLYALCYDAVNDSPPYRQLLTAVVGKLNLQPGQRILDAGCGTGNLIGALSNPGPADIQIEAVDNNQAMLNRARKKPRRVKTRFRLADLDQKLPFADHWTDRIVSIHVLYALKNPGYTLREFSRVLKPGGLLVLANPHCQSSPSAIMRENLKGLSAWEKFWLLATRLPLIVINIIICRRGRAGRFHFLSEQELRGLLEKAGFVNITVELAYAGQDLLITAQKR